MKKLFALFTLLLMITAVFANTLSLETKVITNLNLSGDSLLKTKTNPSLKVYYFHATNRCITCIEVEDVTAKTIKDKYGDKIPFESIDVDEDEDNPLIKKYNVEFQTLLIIKGDKVVNLTNYAFLNATTHPERLSTKIIETIDTMNKE